MEKTMETTMMRYTKTTLGSRTFGGTVLGTHDTDYSICLSISGSPHSGNYQVQLKGIMGQHHPFDP